MPNLLIHSYVKSSCTQNVFTLSTPVSTQWILGLCSCSNDAIEILVEFALRFANCMPHRHLALEESFCMRESSKILINNCSLKAFGDTCSMNQIYPVLRSCECTAWFKKMDSISYVYISWTIHGMWMIYEYITFERGGPKFSNTTARALA